MAKKEGSRRRVRVDRWDLFSAVGLGLLAAGLVWVWWPLALVVPGTILLAIGLIGAVLAGRRGAS